MKKAAIFIHGFNISDAGAKTVDKFKPAFQKRNYDVFDLDYHWVFLGMARIFNKSFARRLKNRIDNLKANNYDEITVVAHSNGCYLTWLATNWGAPADNLV